MTTAAETGFGARRIREMIRRARHRKERESVDDGSVSDDVFAGRLRSKYQQPLLQIFLQRRVAPDCAQELIHYAFAVACEDMRNQDLTDSSVLETYLYRMACSLAVSYWQGEALNARKDSLDDLEV